MISNIVNIDIPKNKYYSETTIYPTNPTFYKVNSEMVSKSIYNVIRQLCTENNVLQQELTDYKERINKAIEIINEGLDFDNPQYADETQEELLEILDKKDEVVTINRDMTHFFDGVAELDTTPLLSSEEILKIIRESEMNKKNVDNTRI